MWKGVERLRIGPIADLRNGDRRSYERKIT